MPLKRLLLLAAVGTLLTGCSSTDHKEEAATKAESPTSESPTSSETPTTTSRKHDLNTKSGFIYHIKEHGTIPDFYLDVFGAGASEEEDGPTSYEVNATTLKKAGSVACENEQILDDAKYLLTMATAHLKNSSLALRSSIGNTLPSTKSLKYQRLLPS
ncbi:hypothetical protein [Corynebacterium tuberculostearicum]|uniref:hypothetical protein n=1 Tax=Corynebacterium tuberculostearicum TaxID=38304 RepID=UPI0020275601|nr:hypothetical protein [Corynebacterium tuberculostearicum]MCG7459167.1 hypothetical protein [Corynebacterium tuberculostearicum]